MIPARISPQALAQAQQKATWHLSERCLAKALAMTAVVTCILALTTSASPYASAAYWGMTGATLLMLSCLVLKHKVPKEKPVDVKGLYNAFVASKGVDLDRVRNYEQEALFYAISEGNCEIVQSLLRAGAKGDTTLATIPTSSVPRIGPNRFRFQGSPRNELTTTYPILAAHYALDYIKNSIVWAGHGGAADRREKARQTYQPRIDGIRDCLSLIIEKGVNPNVSVGEVSLLQICIAHGFMDQVQALLRLQVDLKIPTESPPLFHAIQTRNKEWVELLLKVDSSIVNLPKQGGVTPLMSAAMSQDPEITTLLLRNGAHTHAIDDQGKNALHYFTTDQIVQILLQEGVDPLLVDKAGNKPNILFSAITMGNVSAVERILRDAPEKMNPPSGPTPLMHAVIKNLPDVVALLVELKANVNARVDVYRGKTALHFATSPEVVKILLDAGADPFIECSDFHKPSLIHFVVQAGDHANVKRLIDRSQVNITKDGGMTPLMYAAFHKHKDITSLLLANGADVHAVDSLGRSALHHAKTAEIAQLLIEAGANPELRDKGGDCPSFSQRSQDEKGQDEKG